MKILFFTMFCFLVLQVQAQNKFRSQNYIGILDGGNGTSFQVQSINGLERKTWFAGIGTGLDYYYFRSVPLFLSINKYLCNCDRSLFFSIDGGYHWVWDNNTGNVINGYRNGDFSAGTYWAAGFGYKIGLKNKKDAILLNAGFSAKHIKEEVKSSNFCIWPPCPESSEKFTYRLNRFSLRAGWRF